METPVLLCVFNRPNQARRAIDRLRAVQPRKLYVAGDGPRPGHSTDIERCIEVRTIVSQIDWPCDVLYNFCDQNVGCRNAVGGAITWLFQHEEEGIILEDDVIADPTFFDYSADLLERYRDDERIGIISGCNATSGAVQPEDSYYFVRNLLMLGWATWKRVWRLVDLEMKDWNQHRSAAFIRARYGSPWATQQAWERHFDNTVNRRRTDVWDYQVGYALWRRGLLSVSPNVNLIDNDGFGEGATHPEIVKPSWMLNSPQRAMRFPLRHPTEVKIHPTADAIIDRDVFSISVPRSLHIWAKMQLRRVRHFFTGRYA